MNKKNPVIQKIEVDNHLIKKMNRKIETLQKRLDKQKADAEEDREMLSFLMVENERLMLYVNEALNLDSMGTIKKTLRKAIRHYCQLSDATEPDRTLYKTDF